MKNLIILASLLLVVGITQVRAQPGSTGPAPDPTPIPLDGGASLLLASGVAYGLKKLRQRRAR